MLADKLIIKANLVITTGLHIGASGDFSPIGAVDSPIVRNPLNYQPIIPGSSIKGKMRSLLASYFSELPLLQEPNKDSEKVRKLFGDSNSSKGEKMLKSRLQFYDIELTSDSEKKLKNADLDLPYTEIKFENVINRGSGEATPRQIERVVAGSEFEFKLVYNVDSLGDLEDDFKNIAIGFKLLENDYIGGSGTRGYGRVKFENLEVESLLENIDKDKIQKLKELLSELE